MNNLLLHICCGVCAVGLINKFKQDGAKVTGYFYNPNIHPFMEFRKRLRAVEVLSEQEKMTIHYETGYGLDEFLAAVSPDGVTFPTRSLRGSGTTEAIPFKEIATLSRQGGVARNDNGVVETYKNNRCLKCYRMRLARTAQKAKELGFDSFASTLMVSPQQDQAAIKNIGENIAKATGIGFKYETVTDLYHECKELAKQRHLYRQQYCGCVFSEYERYNTKDDK